jgi:hypothetical protein
MPAVNYDLMHHSMLTKTPGKAGQVIYWGRPLDWHNYGVTAVFFSPTDLTVIFPRVFQSDAPEERFRR